MAAINKSKLFKNLANIITLTRTILIFCAIVLLSYNVSRYRVWGGHCFIVSFFTRWS